MLAQIIDKFDTWFGRTFLLARFFPWLLFAASNLALASVEFPSVRAFVLAEYQSLSASQKFIDLVLALGGVAVVAFTISPAIRPITALLEGQNLWRWIAEPLLFRRSRQTARLAERSRILFDNRAALPGSEEVKRRLSAARAAGAGLGAITDRDMIDLAERELRGLRALRALNRQVPHTIFGRALAVLSAALQRNCVETTELRPPIKPADLVDAERLRKMHLEVVEELAPYAKELAQNIEARAYDRHQNLFGKAELAPTRLGNDVAALRSYCKTRYCMEFDFFWPRLQLVMKDEKVADALATARIQVDFSILSLTLSAVFVVTWLLVLGAVGTSLVALFIVAVAGPPVVAVWLWIVHQSYSGYAELVRGAIDVSRFDLLGALKQPLPTTLAEEKAAWDRVGRWLILGGRNDVTFTHPAS